MVVKKEWLRKKLKRLKKQNMERKSKDINVFVTGVSMEGESEIDDNNRIVGEDKRKSSKKENSTIREDGAGQSV
jgi:hypothetical protein